MNRRCCLLISLCIVAGLLLAGCGTADTKPSGDQARAEQVLRNYSKPGMFMTIDDGRHIWKIVLTRENTDAPWTMTDWGPVLDE